MPLPPLTWHADVAAQAHLLEGVWRAHPALDTLRHSRLDWEHSAAPAADKEGVMEREKVGTGRCK